jgi:hypothetical protein
LNAIEFINTINLTPAGGLWILYRWMISTLGGKKNRDQGSTATKGGSWQAQRSKWLYPQSRTPFVSDIDIWFLSAKLIKTGINDPGYRIKILCVP